MNTAPWPDFAGRTVREGDTITHPSSECGVVVFLSEYTDAADQWRVDYGTGVLSRLILQLGDRGQATVVANNGETEMDYVIIVNDNGELKTISATELEAYNPLSHVTLDAVINDVLDKRSQLEELDRLARAHVERADDLHEMAMDAVYEVRS